MSSIVFQPFLTGPLLLALTKGPPGVQEPFAKIAQLLGPYIAKLPFDITKERVTTSLAWLFALGIAGRLNTWLNTRALTGGKTNRKDEWKWDREVAVVTGGSNGIGLSIVNGLLRKGVKVAVWDLAPLPKDLQGSDNVRYYKVDVTDSSAVREAAGSVRSDLGHPTILVNNAGIGHAKIIVDSDDAYLHKIFGVNILSHFYTCREFLPDMTKNDHGHIVGIASMASFVAPVAMAHYSATKAGVLAFHETLNQEIRHYHKTPGVLTTVVHPSWTATALTRAHQAELEKAQGPLMDAEYVGKAIYEHVLSCKGGQIFLPGWMSRISSIRGWPNWLQEVVRDSTATVAEKYDEIRQQYLK